VALPKQVDDRLFECERDAERHQVREGRETDCGGLGTVGANHAPVVVESVGHQIGQVRAAGEEAVAEEPES
jgi:hypothetical protein